MIGPLTPLFATESVQQPKIIMQGPPSPSGDRRMTCLAMSLARLLRATLNMHWKSMAAGLL
jgi:hypothetical protein